MSATADRWDRAKQVGTSSNVILEIQSLALMHQELENNKRGEWQRDRMKMDNKDDRWRSSYSTGLITYQLWKLAHSKI